MDAKILGFRIRQAREKLRISQEEFAALVSKDQRAISEYENGRRKLPAIDIPTFAQVLQVPILYFYTGESYSDDLDNEILHEFHRLPNIVSQEAAIQVLQAHVNAVNIVYNSTSKSSDE